VLCSEQKLSWKIELREPLLPYTRNFFSTRTFFFLDIYDVKIDITNSSGDRIARIFNGSDWQSTYNYVNRAINISLQNYSSFLLNITQLYNGSASMAVKVRAGSSVESFSGYSLNIIYKNETQSQENQTQQNQTQNQSQQDQEQEAGIYLELEYDEEVKNGKEFEVKIFAYNLQDKSYDAKIYIAFDNSSIISETYNENREEWKSSTYYVNDVLRGPGNKSKSLELRISSEYENFKGNAKIKARIRASGETYIAEFEDEIEILEKELGGEGEDTGKDAGTETNETATLENSTTSIIRLNNPKSIKTRAIREYKSKTQYIKEYAIYGFALFCVFIIILLIIKKL
jgi:hypothetical protein